MDFPFWYGFYTIVGVVYFYYLISIKIENKVLLILEFIEYIQKKYALS